MYLLFNQSSELKIILCRASIFCASNRQLANISLVAFPKPLCIVSLDKPVALGSRTKCRIFTCTPIWLDTLENPKRLFIKSHHLLFYAYCDSQSMWQVRTLLMTTNFAALHFLSICSMVGFDLHLEHVEAKGQKSFPHNAFVLWL